jgi:hypothetical protein
MCTNGAQAPCAFTLPRRTHLLNTTLTHSQAWQDAGEVTQNQGWGFEEEAKVATVANPFTPCKASRDFTVHHTMPSFAHRNNAGPSARCVHTRTHVRGVGGEPSRPRPRIHSLPPKTSAPPPVNPSPIQKTCSHKQTSTHRGARQQQQHLYRCTLALHGQVVRYRDASISLILSRSSREIQSLAATACGRNNIAVRERKKIRVHACIHTLREPATLPRSLPSPARFFGPKIRACSVAGAALLLVPASTHASGLWSRLRLSPREHQ